MKILIIFAGFAALIFLIWRWMEMKKAIGGTPASAQKHAVSYLFAGFLAFTGISSVIGTLLFELFEFKQPQYVELMALVAYGFFCVAVALIFHRKQVSIQKENEGIVTENKMIVNVPSQINRDNASNNTQTNTFNN